MEGPEKKSQEVNFIHVLNELTMAVRGLKSLSDFSSTVLLKIKNPMYPTDDWDLEYAEMSKEKLSYSIQEGDSLIDIYLHCMKEISNDVNTIRCNLELISDYIGNFKEEYTNGR